MRAHVVCDKIKPRPLLTAGRPKKSLAVARRTQPLTTRAGMLQYGVPPLEILASWIACRMGNWGARQMWRKQGPCYGCCYFLTHTLALALAPALALCLVLIYFYFYFHFFLFFHPLFFLWRVSVCCVLINSTQSGTGDEHMRCMYVGIVCIHPQTAKLRCTRKKISLALPIARPPRQVVESDCALCWPEAC